jgi:hypothetical protein
LNSLYPPRLLYTSAACTTRYEKAHEASSIINAIKATKIISRLDLRILLADGDA